MPDKKLKSKKNYKLDHTLGQPWGVADDIPHWMMLMHEWAKQVNETIHKYHGPNPDDPPDTPWDEE